MFLSDHVYDMFLMLTVMSSINVAQIILLCLKSVPVLVIQMALFFMSDPSEYTQLNLYL